MRSSAQDAIGSVANYFIAHGWTPGMPTHFGVQPAAAPRKPTNCWCPTSCPPSAPACEARGAVLDAAGARYTGPLALVELQNGDNPPSYVAGTESILRHHALQLVELLRHGRHRAGPGCGRSAPLTPNPP